MLPFQAVQVLAIRPDAVGPSGIHLRWAFTADLGFPRGGFEVFRMQALKFPTLALDPARADHLRITRSNTSGASWLRGSLAEPAVEVTVLMRGFTGGAAPVVLRGYARDARGARREVANTIAAPAGGAGLRTATLRAAFVTDFVIEPGPSELVGVEVVAHTQACADAAWEKVATLPLICERIRTATPERIVNERLEAGLANRYAVSASEARDRYRSTVGDLADWQRKVVGALTDPDGLDRLSRTWDAERAPTADHPLPELDPLAVLQISAMEPNLARLLSLYWTDRGAGADSPPLPAFHYRVDGRWDGWIRSGLALDVGAEVAGRPRMSDDDRGVRWNQLPGIRWDGEKPSGRAGIHWERPLATGAAEAVRPALFDVERVAVDAAGIEVDAHQLTVTQPVLVPDSAWAGDGALFVDSVVPLGRHSYRVRGIDLFGQVSDPRVSAMGEIRDLELPPPPVRLRAALQQPGYPWRTDADRARVGAAASLTVTWEYGALQHRQGPDAVEFRAYWRQGGLTESIAVQLAVHGEAGLTRDGRMYRIALTPEPASGTVALAALIPGTLTNVVPGAPPPPALLRRHYPVSGEGGALFLVAPPDEPPPSPGVYRLAGGAGSAAWGEPIAVVPARAPLDAALRSLEVAFTASVRRVERVGAERSPLDFLPSDRRPGSRAPTCRELYLDRALLEPGLFAGGTAEAGGREWPILYSTAGEAYDVAAPERAVAAARVALPESADLATGDTVLLSGPGEFVVAAADVRVEVADPRAPVLVLQQEIVALTADYLLDGRVELRGLSFQILAAETAGARLRLTLRARQPLPTPIGDVRVAPRALRTARLAGVQRASLQPSSSTGASVQPLVPEGGQLSFRVPGHAIPRTAAVVADRRWRGADLELLVRFPRDLAAAELPRAGDSSHLFPPFGFARADVEVVLGGAPVSEELAIPIPAGVGATSAFIAVAAVDGAPVPPGTVTDPVTPRPRQGPLSRPVQVTAVKPPPGAPLVPVPCGTLASGFPVADAGYATPPDAQGRATVCLEWAHDGAEPDLRYEVARALDTGIVAAARRAWLLGGTVDVGAAAAGSVHGTIAHVEEENGGTFLVEVRVTAAGADPAALRGGRLRVANAAGLGMSFQVTGAAAAPAGTATYDLLVRARPLSGIAGPSAADCTVEPAPDFDALLADPGRLRAMASTSAIGDAWALVSGVPVRQTGFLDEVPGVGRGRFFYRVCAVDRAENRSPWSGVSVPFNTVRTTPPEAPRLVAAFGGVGRARVAWRAANDDRVIGYEVARVVEGLATAPPAGSDRRLRLVRVPGPGDEALRASPFPVRAGTLDLVGGMSLPPGLSLAGAGARITGVFQLGPAGEPEMGLDLIVREPTLLAGRSVTRVNPAIADGAPVVLAVRAPDGEEWVLDRDRSGRGPLLVNGGSVDFAFPHAVTAVVGVWEPFGFLPDAVPVTAQTARNLAGPATLYNAATRTITGLTGGHGRNVVVAVRHAPGGGAPEETRILYYRTCMSRPLVAQGGSVALDLPDGPLHLLGVYRGDDYARRPPAPPPVNLHLTRATTYDAGRRRLEHLNPALPDGAGAAVRLADAGGAVRLLLGRADEYGLVEEGLSGLPPGGRYTYTVRALARVELIGGAAEIPSLPSAPVRVQVVDAAAP